MANSGWTWAALTQAQLDKIAEAERSLGTDYLLAYRAEASARGGDVGALGIKAAQLNDTQRECLRGLETQIGTVLVAYKRARVSLKSSMM